MFQSKKTLFLIILGVGILVSAGILAKPAYHKFKDMRATILSNAAYESYMLDPTNRQVIEDAVRKAKSASFLSPENYETNRTLAVLTLFSQPQVSLKYWEQSLTLWDKDKPVPLDDTMHYVQCLLVTGEFEKAYDVLIGIEGDEKIRAEIDYNLAKVCFLLGRKDEAIKFGREMVRNRYTPISLHLFYSGICLDSESPEIRKEGERHLRILFENDDLVDDSVLWNMTQFNNLSPQLSKQLKNKLYSRVTTFDDRITLGEYQIENHLKTPEVVYEELILELDRRDELAVIHLAQWTSKYDLVTQTLGLLSDELALRRKDWFLLYVRNLGKDNQWNKIIDLLETQDCPIEEFWSYILKADAYFENGKIADAINNWYRAKLGSHPTRNHYWLLSRMGDKFGLQEDTKDMLHELVIIGEQPEKVLAYIAQREFSEGDYEGFYQELEYFRENYLGHPDILNDWAYYSILMNRNEKVALPAITKLIEQFPTQLRYHMTWAVAQIKSKKYREVLERFKGFDLEWKELHVKWRFILALALAGVGEFDQAFEYFPETDKVALNPYELTLFEKLFYNR